MSNGERENWILVTDAPARVGRHKRTIYRWIDERRIRTMRPLMKLWVYLPDLLEADRVTVRRTRAERS